MSIPVKAAKTISKSTFILIVLALVLSEYFIGIFNPLKQLNATGFTSIRQYFVVSKLPEFLASNGKPDIVIAGSSLMLYPAVRCDDELYGRKARFDHAYVRNVVDPYPSAKYLEMLLAQKTNSHFDIANLATAGGLISDEYVVFRKCLLSQKKPKLLLLDISPREFIDNNQLDPEKTPVYVALSDYTCLGDLIESKAGFLPIMQSLVGDVWSFYRNRQDWNYFFTHLAATITKHPTDIYAASHQVNEAEAANVTAHQINEGAAGEEKPDYVGSKNVAPDLSAYKRMYLPINNRCYNLQLKYLQKLLRLAKQNDVAVLMVEMPLTSGNIDLLPQDFLNQFHREVQSLASTYQASVIEPAKLASFDDSTDFEDSAHLTASGGHKLYPLLADRASIMLNARLTSSKPERN
jgi:hypothetical protein